jgi:hypothetical protein
VRNERVGRAWGEGGEGGGREGDSWGFLYGFA